MGLTRNGDDTDEKSSGEKYGHKALLTTDKQESDIDTEDNSDFKPKTLVEKIFPTGFKKEFIELMKYSWPIAATILLNTSNRFMATIFSGHLGKIELDAVAMGLSIANVIATSIGIGMISACDTLFSQSFGSSNKTQVGVYLQTAVYVSTLCCIVSWGLLVNTKVILLALGQNPLVARYAAEYLDYFMPSLEFLFLYQLFSRYLQMQDCVIPCIFIGIFSNVLNVVLQYSLVYLLGMGIRGSATSQVVAYFSLGFFTLVYTKMSGAYKGTWAGFSRNSLQDWGEFFKLGVSTIMMICLEMWAFEIGTFLMGILGSTDLGASSILMTIWGLYGSISTGIGNATAYRSGRYLGAKKPLNAKTATRVAMFVACSSAIFSAVFTLALKSYIPYLFTSDPDVVEMATDLLPIMAAFSFFGALRNICSGIIRGTGNQTIGGIASFISYFLVGLPIGISLMFLTSAGASGFWWGQTLGIMLNSTCLFVIIYKIDWVLESENAQIRAKVKVSLNQQTSEMVDTCSDSLHGKTGNAKLLDELDERQSILSSKSPKKTESYGIANSNPEVPRLNTEDETKKKTTYWCRLSLLRALTCSLCLCWLALGILCRFLIFTPSFIESHFVSNFTVTIPVNLTLVSTRSNTNSV